MWRLCKRCTCLKTGRMTLYWSSNDLNKNFTFYINKYFLNKYFLASGYHFLKLIDKKQQNLFNIKYIPKYCLQICQSSKVNGSGMCCMQVGFELKQRLKLKHINSVIISCVNRLCLFCPRIWKTDKFQGTKTTIFRAQVLFPFLGKKKRQEKSKQMKMSL